MALFQAHTGSVTVSAVEWITARAMLHSDRVLASTLVPWTTSIWLAYQSSCVGIWFRNRSSRVCHGHLSGFRAPLNHPTFLATVKTQSLTRRTFIHAWTKKSFPGFRIQDHKEQGRINFAVLYFYSRTALCDTEMIIVSSQIASEN